MVRSDRFDDGWRSYSLVVLFVMFSLVGGALLIVPTTAEITYTVHYPTEARDIQMFLYESGNLSTNVPTSASGTLVNIDDGSQVTFTSSYKLGKDLEVMGVDVGGGTKGVLANLPMASFAAATVTVTLKDGPTVVATKDVDSSEFLTQPVGLPFTGTWDSYVFHQGRNILLTLNASVPSGSVGLTVENSNTLLAAYLQLRCEQIVEGDSTIQTLDVNDEETTSIYPNVPESSRVLKIEGDFFDSIGSYDVFEVNVTILDPARQAIHDSAALLIRTSNWIAHYNYTWFYPTGLGAGTYTIEASATDNSGNAFTIETTIDLSQYGVLLSTSQRDKTGAKGDSVSYTVTVTNVGGSSDTITLTTGIDPSSWAARVEPASVSLNAGADTTVNVIVDVPMSATPATEATISLTGKSTGSAAAFYDLDLTVTVTAVSNFDFIATTATTQQVGWGEVAFYYIDLANTGADATTFAIVLVDDPPTGWEYSMSGGVSDTPATGYLKNTAFLQPQEQVQITIAISAPADEIATDSVTVNIEAYPETMPSSAKTITTSTTATSAAETLISIPEASRIKTASEDLTKPNSVAFTSVEFQVKLFNSYSTDLDVYLAATPQSGWTTDITPVVTVPVGGEVLATLRVYPADGATATTSGKGYSVVVNASTTGALMLYDEVLVYVKIPTVERMSWSVEGNNDTREVTDPGNTAQFNLSLTNTGNAMQSITLSQKNDKDWVVELSQTEFTVGSGGVRAFTLKVITPKGDYSNQNCTVTLTMTYGTSKTMEMKLHVKMVIAGANWFSDFLAENAPIILIMGFFLIIIIIVAGIAFTRRGKLGQDEGESEKDSSNADLKYLK